MVTMVDEIFDRHYREGRNALNAALEHGFGRLAHAVRNAFEVLVNIEYHEPWKTKSRKAPCN